MSRIFVLGSNSFAGTSFIDYALHQEAEVVAVSRSPEAPVVFNAYRKNHNRAKLQFFQKNITTEFKEVVSLIRDFEPDFIVDFAGQSLSTQSWIHPTHWYRTNVLTKVKLFEEVRKMPFVKRFLRISAPDVYGKVSGLVKESQGLAPQNPYAITHATQDMTLAAYHRNYKFPVVSIRASYFYGQHQQFYRLIPRMIIHGKLEKKLTIHGKSDMQRSYLHIWDFCEAAWKVLNSGEKGEVYHIGSSEKISVGDLAQKITEKLGVRDFITFTGESTDSSSYNLDDTKLKANLSWKPEVDLDQGIEQVIEWVDQHLDVIQDLPLDYLYKE